MDAAMILNDTGWRVAHEGRCYVAQVREVDFSRNTREADVVAFAKEERERWHGQEFAFAFEPSTYRLRMSRSVDSGD